MATVIRKLDETVVNRIAAGEVIQRPSNAVKEMIENSLDAKATSIQIVVTDGGLKFLQIQDNGTGIRKEDLGIVCERFTTSKLKEYEDLKEIATYGFRGEALASISHVARLTIVTRTIDSKCAFKATYIDSKIMEPPKPCAANVGTQIMIEDLFYNVPTRRKAFKNVSEEYAKIAEVVSHYAIHNATVGFSLKKKGSQTFDVQTNQNSTHVDNICNIFTKHLSNELLEVNDEDENCLYKLHGFISNANYPMKKGKFLLFINNRLVDCVSLRKGIANVYSAYLPKNMHSFSYLSLQLPPSNIDVNVHPTKHEVKFLHEDIIVEKIQKKIDSTLLGCHSSRTFYTQTLLPTSITSNLGSREELSQSSQDSAKKLYSHQTVRTDSKMQKLDVMFHKPMEKTAELEVIPIQTDSDEIALPKTSADNQNTVVTRQEINLDSVLSLQEAIKDECQSDMRQLFKFHTFVGCIDREYALIQHETKLYIVNSSRISELLFYQILINDFGNFGKMKLSSSAPIYELAMLGLNDKESGWCETDGPKDELARTITDLLITKGEMLNEYFSVEIDKDGNLCSLPLLLDNYVPEFEGLPMYILKLATEVNWETEKECFETFSRETAQFFAFSNEEFENVVDESGLLDEQSQENEEKTSNWKCIVENVLYPALKASFLPPKRCAEDRLIRQVANLPDLYKVFERC